ncbi:hypothetical protein ACFOZ7_05655 [Natribaculum luteum]|uniref:Antitoxin VbhA domain-containing protein n=1 Tax=Natribaculum luteum TaxID=1586232 RepID=A0ABD5NWK6_9EURY|nr:hypothetical protein [Natribaculum luteum]
MTQEQLALGYADQIEAFENAEAAIQRDFDAGVVDGREWGGSLTAGEVVRILAEAYTGQLDLEPARAEG